MDHSLVEKNTIQMLKRPQDKARLEARVSGSPVIRTDVGEVRRFVNEGETGKLFQLSIAVELTDMISELLSQLDNIQ